MRTAAGLSSPSLVVAIPTLNEEAHVGTCVRTILAQLGPADRVYVADGGSTDRTVAIVRAVAAEDPRVAVIHNARKFQSAAVNEVAELAGGSFDFVLRVDAHAHYPQHFVRTLIEAQRTTEADSVVVPMQAVGSGAVQRAAAAAQNSVLGNGGSAHRRGATSRWVDHGHHALFRLPSFLGVGGYDPTFTHNEDFELDHRLRAAGGRIYLALEAMIDYYPRSTLPALARQYFKYGRGRARSSLKHRLMPKVRQLLPVAILGANVLGVALAPFWPAALALPAVYALICVAYGAVLAAKAGDPALLLAGPVAMVMHLAWGFGFVVHTARALLSGLRGGAGSGLDRAPAAD